MLGFFSFVGVMLIITLVILKFDILKMFGINIKIKPNLPVFTLGIILGLFLSLTPKLFFWAERGNIYFLVYPNGTTGVITEQGFKTRAFAKIDVWPKFLDVKTLHVDSKGDIINAEGMEELEGILKPTNIRFIDQVTATAYISVKLQLPSDEPTFTKLALKYRTAKNLTNNTIIPTINEQLTNTGYMFAAQDYISGESQNFRQTFEEQLVRGSFSVRKIAAYDTTYNDNVVKRKADRVIKDIKTSYTVVKNRDENGKFIRIPHELSVNNIVVSQVIVDDIDLEAAFKTRLQKQRDESAIRQLEQQKVKTAKDAKARVLAEGERDKAIETVKMETEQISILVAEETKLKNEETKRQLAEIQFKTAELAAKTRRVTADAEAYEITKKVSAGITPETRLRMELEARVKIAAEMSKLKFPANMTIINGSSTKSDGNSALEALISAAMAKQLIEK